MVNGSLRFHLEKKEVSIGSDEDYFATYQSLCEKFEKQGISNSFITHFFAWSYIQETEHVNVFIYYDFLFTNKNLLASQDVLEQLIKLQFLTRDDLETIKNFPEYHDPSEPAYNTLEQIFNDISLKLYGSTSVTLEEGITNTRFSHG